MPTTKQRRDNARRRLERQIQRRQEAAAARRRRNLITAAAFGVVLVVGAVFLLVTQLPANIHLLTRELVGPRLFGTWVAINPYEAAFGFALSLMLTAPMLAAAVDWLVRTRTAAGSPAAGTASHTRHSDARRSCSGSRNS